MDSKHYEDILRARSRELYTRLHKIERDLERTPDPDSAERATENENDEVLEELGNSGEQELRAIDAALERIAKGTFGRCARCGEAISQARLAAVPHAALCEACIAEKA